jgi:arabinose-5-phosphate isomerase
MTDNPRSSSALIAAGSRALAIEARALAALSGRLDDSFARACQLCLDASGRVVVCGLGKSGHVGRKVAATLASTGTPSFFLHAAEASHGDLGMARPPRYSPCCRSCAA